MISEKAPFYLPNLTKMAGIFFIIFFLFPSVGQGKDGNGRLIAILVGVNKYNINWEDPSYNVSHSVPIMTEAIRAFGNRAGFEMDDIIICQIDGQEPQFINKEDICRGKFEPTREVILGLLSQVKTFAQRSDTVIFYFIGHGHTHASGDLLLHGSESVLTTNDGAFYLDAVVRKLTRHEENESDTYRRRKPKKIYIFLDACRVLNDKGQSKLTGGISSSKFELYREFGAKVFVSSAVKKVSHIHPTLKTGYFTINLAKGLAGGAHNDDLTLTGRELIDFVEERTILSVEKDFKKEKTQQPEADPKLRITTLYEKNIRNSEENKRSNKLINVRFSPIIKIDNFEIGLNESPIRVRKELWENICHWVYWEIPKIIKGFDSEQFLNMSWNYRIGEAFTDVTNTNGLLRDYETCYVNYDSNLSRVSVEESGEAQNLTMDEEKNGDLTLDIEIKAIFKSTKSPLDNAKLTYLLSSKGNSKTKEKRFFYKIEGIEDETQWNSKYISNHLKDDLKEFNRNLRLRFLPFTHNHPFPARNRIGMLDHCIKNYELLKTIFLSSELNFIFKTKPIENSRILPICMGRVKYTINNEELLVGGEFGFSKQHSSVKAFFQRKSTTKKYKEKPVVVPINLPLTLEDKEFGDPLKIDPLIQQEEELLLLLLMSKLEIGIRELK